MKALMIQLPDDPVVAKTIKRLLAGHAIQWTEVELPTVEERNRLAEAVKDVRQCHDIYERDMENGDVRHHQADANHMQRGALLDLIEGLLDGKLRL